MKPLIIDRKTHRAGLLSKNARGEGETRLLNEQGYMCCLGSWCLDRMEIAKEELVNKVYPSGLFRDSMMSKVLNRAPDFWTEWYEGREYDQIEDLFIMINDDREITNEERERRLIKLAAHFGEEWIFVD